MIKIFHLNNGDTIIGEVKHKRWTRTVIHNPMKLQPMFDPSTMEQYIKLVDMLMYSSDTDVNVRNTVIFAENEASETIVNYYLKAVEASERMKKVFEKHIDEIITMYSGNKEQPDYSNMLQSMTPTRH